VVLTRNLIQVIDSDLLVLGHPGYDILRTKVEITLAVDLRKLRSHWNVHFDLAFAAKFTHRSEPTSKLD